MRLVRTIGVAVFASLAAPAVAVACTCVGWSDIDEVARQAPLVLVGHFTATGDARYAGPRWADFQVERTVKGAPAPPVLRLWDPWALSDCGGLLDEAAIGETIVIALTPVSVAAETSKELWAALEFPVPPSSDAVIFDGACQEPLKILRSKREKQRWLKRRLGP